MIKEDVNESKSESSKTKDSRLVLSDEKEQLGVESLEDHSNELNDENI